MTEDRSDMMVMVVPTHIFRKTLIISLATVSLLSLGSPPILPTMCPKVSFMNIEERIMSLLNINSSVGEGTVECSCSLGISEKLYITSVEDATFRLMHYFMFTFLPLPFLSYSRPPVCIELL